MNKDTESYVSILRRSVIAVVVCSLGLFSSASAQSVDARPSARQSYTARILDAETGEAQPLVGVYIDENNNTLSNFEGEFTLAAAPTDVLKLTCVGRQTLTMSAQSLREAAAADGVAVIRMKMLNASLPEVTVKAVEGQDYEAVFECVEAAEMLGNADGTCLTSKEKRELRRLTATQQIRNAKDEGVALQVRCDSAAGEWRFDITASGQAAATSLGLTVMNEGKLVTFRSMEDELTAADDAQQT